MNLSIYDGKISNIDYLDLLMIDIHGNIRHVSLPKNYVYEKVIKEGIGFDASNFGFAKIAKSDMVAVPDMNTAFLEEKEGYKILHVFCDVINPSTGEIFDQYPRNIIKMTKDYLTKNMIAEDLKMLVELEFYVFDTVNYSSGIDHSYYNVESIEGIGESYNTEARFDIKAGYHRLYPEEKYFTFRNAIVDQMQAIGIPVKYHHHEVGASQLEIELDFISIDQVADKVSLTKWIIKSIAQEFDFKVTFMPKPMYKMPGSGMHVHQFMEKGGASIFIGDKIHGLSELALNYLCGILDHSLSGSLLGFTNPSTNSYRRLVPGYEAPISATFAQGSRSAAIRIPGYLKKNSVRIEYRTADASCNIYYALSAMVLAGIDGINKKSDPVKKGYNSDVELEDKIFPIDLRAVLSGLKKDSEYLRVVFPESLINEWIKIKSKEAEYIYNAPTSQEYELYF